MAEWYLIKLNRFVDLNDIQQREEILTEMKIKFANLSANESKEIARNLDLSRLFYQLTSNEKYVVQNKSIF